MSTNSTISVDSNGDIGAIYVINIEDLLGGGDHIWKEEQRHF